MIKGSIQSPDITILNVHGFEKYMTQKQIGLKEENHTCSRKLEHLPLEQHTGLLENQQGSRMFEEYIQEDLSNIECFIQ